MSVIQHGDLEYISFGLSPLKDWFLNQLMEQVWSPKYGGYPIRIKERRNGDIIAWELTPYGKTKGVVMSFPEDDLLKHYMPARTCTYDHPAQKCGWCRKCRCYGDPVNGNPRFCQLVDEEYMKALSNDADVLQGH